MYFQILVPPLVFTKIFKEIFKRTLLKFGFPSAASVLSSENVEKQLPASLRLTALVSLTHTPTLVTTCFKHILLALYLASLVYCALRPGLVSHLAILEI